MAKLFSKVVQCIANLPCQRLAFRTRSDVFIVTPGKITVSTGALPEALWIDMCCRLLLHMCSDSRCG